jgi:hypothetical protein
MTEEQALAAVDATIADAQAQPTPQPTDTSADDTYYNNASLAEPSLKARCSPLVRVTDFKRAVKKDTGAQYGWEFKLTLEEEVDDDADGKLPVGHEIPFLKVFTTPNDNKTQAAIDRTCALMLCAFNGIVCDLKADPGLKKAMDALRALPPERRKPTPLDPNDEHYKQWIGTVVRATLKPGKPDNSGRPQIDLQGLAAYVGASNPV